MKLDTMQTAALRDYLYGNVGLRETARSIGCPTDAVYRAAAQVARELAPKYKQDVNKALKKL